ncbi:hypothetical protein EYF80_061269 [Liparis tanakae]|uniref:Uncharacterized protein n=1 Tax=Liparis tanakae TaxID=230148 RepID=A0A4Z2EIY1_9TELE|nr:hypothetical protein EYF80_061269 [Liparis tanakae]
MWDFLQNAPPPPRDKPPIHPVAALAFLSSVEPSEGRPLSLNRPVVHLKASLVVRSGPERSGPVRSGPSVRPALNVTSVPPNRADAFRVS